LLGRPLRISIIHCRSDISDMASSFFYSKCGMSALEFPP
jgi:hypothetical protein